ncbi:MAG: hypothetical protein K2P68_09520 [Sphingomonas sp.]|nr:hypothetical protein [Sphingomonas sp.]
MHVIANATTLIRAGRGLKSGIIAKFGDQFGGIGNDGAVGNIGQQGHHRLRAAGALRYVRP